MKRTALILMAITIISKIFGFTRDIVLSYFYGTSATTDAYVIAVTIPTVIFAFIGVGIVSSFIPMYSKIEAEADTESADIFTNNILNFILLICLGIIFFVLTFTLPIVKIFAPGFEGETLALSTQLTRISVLGLFFSGATFIFGGYLQLKNNFVIPASKGIVLNVVMIIAIIISSKTGNVLILSIGTFLAMGFQVMLFLPFVLRKGFRYKPVIDIGNKDFKNLMVLSVPVILGISVNQINVLVDRTLASKIAIGGISALSYANRLNLFIQGIFVMSLATVMYPMISKMAAENNVEGLKKTLKETMGAIILLVFPTTVGSMFFAVPIVTLLFGRGAFDSEAITLTSSALFFYSIGMLGYALREVLSRAFYSMQDTKTPMINATIGVFLNIVLNIILSYYLGLGGLALATSIAAIFTTGLMLRSFRRKIGPFGMKDIIFSSLKILSASLLMGIFARLSFNYLSVFWGENLSLLIAIGIGAISYFITIYFMKIEDADIIIAAIKKRIKVLKGDSNK